MPKLFIFDAFTLLIREKTVANYALLRCKTFSLKIWVCKIFDKFHVCLRRSWAARLLLYQQMYQVTTCSRPAPFKQRQNHGLMQLTHSYLQIYFLIQIIVTTSWMIFGSCLKKMFFLKLKTMGADLPPLIRVKGQ